VRAPCQRRMHGAALSQPRNPCSTPPLRPRFASVLARAVPGLEADGPDVFHHACMLGLEGIVSKRKDSQYRSGRSLDWIKSKNPNAPAVKREAEEVWTNGGIKRALRA
jgi:hypothetical protein